MTRIIGFITLLLFPALAGCAGVWQPARVQLPFLWKGEQAALFFTKHGGPIETTRWRTGRAFYKWKSQPNQQAIRLAQETYLNPQDRPVFQCELFIEADERGRIVEMEIVKDGIGLWSTSSCDELFKGDPNRERTAFF